MENKKGTQSRREFFKEAAKKALPIIGAVALLGNPVIVKAVETESLDCQHCKGGCRGGCNQGCHRSCKTNCSLACEGGSHKVGPGCESCKTLCLVSCTRGCSSTCTNSCSRGSYSM